jgi:superfamily II DNA/RNA helicase
MNYTDLKNELDKIPSKNINPYEFLQKLCNYYNSDEDTENIQDLVLRSLEKKKCFDGYASILDGLVRELGLFPYLEKDSLNLADTIAYEFHRPINMTPDWVVFHRVQAEVYRLLLSGFNVVLSAPTSFGKSLIIDAVISTDRYKNVVLIVPTIALIDETRIRLSKFSYSYKIITHSSQMPKQKNIFVLTQERAVDYQNIKSIDLLVIDEFYKLQPSLTQDIKRATILNHVFYKFNKIANQYYFLGPNIEGLPKGFDEKYKCIFIKTDYKTVASNTIKITPGKEPIKKLIELCKNLVEPTLIYCKSPKRVRDVVEGLIQSGIIIECSELIDLQKWISEYYHPGWLFGKGLSFGIGMHHGRIPRSLGHLAVKLFNDGFLRFLVCTSTLIEGVNTKAKNVIVFDNKVALRKYDFFTFNNICGRSGRMFEHFVGNIYLFYPPPDEQLPLIDIPVYTQDDDVPNSLLIQLSDEDLSENSKIRIEPIIRQNILDVSVIKSSAGVDPDSQIAFAKTLLSNPKGYYNTLSWKGFPSNSQVYEICELMWDHFIEDKYQHGVSSGKQLAFKIIRTQETRNLRSLVEEELKNNTNIEGPDDAVESILDFVRFWMEFNFPSHLMAMDRIQAYIFQKFRLAPGNYSLYASFVENIFLTPPLYALEEYGIPLPLIFKIEKYFKNNNESLDEVLFLLKRMKIEKTNFTSIERLFIKNAIDTI